MTRFARQERELTETDLHEIERCARYLKLLSDIRDPTPQDRIRLYDIVYGSTPG